VSIRQYLTGRTYSLGLNFFDEMGLRTPVDDATITIYTPQKQTYTTAGLTPDSLVIGKYNYSFYAAAGVTRGHWFALGSGTTASSTVFTESVPFEVIDIVSEPFWLGLTEFREFLGLTDDDHSTDPFLKQMLQSAIELVETYTRRTFGIYTFNENIEIKHTERVTLKHFPIVSLIGLTATSVITPMEVARLFEVVTNQIVPFYFRADMDNGIIHLTDSAGFDLTYDGVLLAITYEAGFLAIPEAVRTATLMLASKLSNLSTSEGIESVRLADLSFTLDRGLMDGPIAEMLKEYRIVGV
jgi:hypothetical protein